MINRLTEKNFSNVPRPYGVRGRNAGVFVGERDFMGMEGGGIGRGGGGGGE